MFNLSKDGGPILLAGKPQVSAQLSDTWQSWRSNQVAENAGCFANYNILQSIMKIGA